MQWPARRSQGCEVARVLNLLDTTRNHGFPLICIANQCRRVLPPIFHLLFSVFRRPCNLSPYLRIVSPDVDPNVSRILSNGQL